jgi:hypothetical protein
MGKDLELAVVSSAADLRSSRSQGVVIAQRSPADWASAPLSRKRRLL